VYGVIGSTEGGKMDIGTKAKLQGDDRKGIGGDALEVGRDGQETKGTTRR
jgi:hypothetical protein